MEIGCDGMGGVGVGVGMVQDTTGTGWASSSLERMVDGSLREFIIIPRITLVMQRVTTEIDICRAACR